jgi:hypothetical protein
MRGVRGQDPTPSLAQSRERNRSAARESYFLSAGFFSYFEALAKSPAFT